MLGQGGFGDVQLVFFNNDAEIHAKQTPDGKPHLYALKSIQKCRIVQHGQQRHIMDEKNILCQMNSEFIVKLRRTFKDNKRVYLLTDAYLGGDLYRLLNSRGPFPDFVAKFYIACVIEALDYMHNKSVVYRDLKPENLMLHKNGYLKLVDLGFAKKLNAGSKTWTFCGTPEYISPEIIANTGHNIATDYWALGILIYEMLTKKTPFRDKDDLRVYENILRGIYSVKFSLKVSKKAELIIKALCRQEANERLGYQKNGRNDIKKHKWFTGFDWDGFHTQSIPAPILPEISDTSMNISRAKTLETDIDIPEEISGWDSSF